LKNFNKRIILLIISYSFIVYAIAFIAVCLNPYWDDNTVLEYIPWEERWSWALLLCILLAPYWLLLLFTIIAIIYFYERFK
jgi:hypothetical protein